MLDHHLHRLAFLSVLAPAAAVDAVAVLACGIFDSETAVLRHHHDR